MAKTRTFEDSVARRKAVPLLIGLAGPSGGGKTYSALRLATGMQRVSGGDIYVVDSEANRSLHYAENFTFRHVPFSAPFSPADYVAVMEHCVSHGAGVCIVDSVSHEWEGPGGVLELHDQEVDRLSKDWGVSKSKVQFPAWAKPKQAHRRMINTILQFPCHFIFCFRAKQKMKPGKGKDLVSLGWQPITGGDLIYEFVANVLLPPGANGVPEWNPEIKAEREMTKRPGWAADILKDKRQLSEDVGTELAQWAAGTKVRSYDEVLADLKTVTAPAALGALRREVQIIWDSASEKQKAALGKAGKDAAARINPPSADEENQGELSPEEEARMERELAERES